MLCSTTLSSLPLWRKCQDLWEVGPCLPLGADEYILAIYLWEWGKQCDWFSHTLRSGPRLLKDWHKELVGVTVEKRDKTCGNRGPVTRWCYPLGCSTDGRPSSKLGVTFLYFCLVPSLFLSIHRTGSSRLHIHFIHCFPVIFVFKSFQ